MLDGLNYSDLSLYKKAKPFRSHVPYALRKGLDGHERLSTVTKQDHIALLLSPPFPAASPNNEKARLVQSQIGCQEGTTKFKLWERPHVFSPAMPVHGGKSLQCRYREGSQGKAKPKYGVVNPPPRAGIPVSSG